MRKSYTRFIKHQVQKISLNTWNSSKLIVQVGWGELSPPVACVYVVQFQRVNIIGTVVEVHPRVGLIRVRVSG